MVEGRLEGPEFAAFFEIDSGVWAFDLTLARIGGTHVDPGFELPDFKFGEARLGRHFQVVICMGDGMDEEGLFRITGDDGGAGISSGFPACAGVEVEVGLELFGIGRVALMTVFDKKRTDVGFEKFQPGGFIGTCRDGARQQGQGDERLR